MKQIILPAWVVLIVLVIVPGYPFAQTSVIPAALPSLQSDSTIHKYLIDRIDAQHKGVGMVVGIITPKSRRIISYGYLNQGDTRSPDGNTIFEIGSLTKVFTALLLSDMAKSGK